MKKPITISIYQDSGGEFRWRMKHGNGRIIADSSESYKKRSGACRAADTFLTVSRTSGFVVAR